MDNCLSIQDVQSTVPIVVTILQSLKLEYETTQSQYLCLFCYILQSFLLAFFAGFATPKQGTSCDNDGAEIKEYCFSA